MTSGLQTDAADEVNFSRDILPILSDRCFHCHGPEPTHREADLRLDEQAAATADRGGHAAIVPGDPAASELLSRISSDDPDVLMPPPASRREKLSPEEIQKFRVWIAGGAKWGKHWAFEKPQRPAVPNEEMHPIDAFIRKRLDKAGLSPSPAADKTTVIRRLSFDITGLPPTPA
ncbi:MAG: c-type cytochrome domain-containing protein, partial [Planctomycetaceae bacterium]